MSLLRNFVSRFWDSQFCCEFGRWLYKSAYGIENGELLTNETASGVYYIDVIVAIFIMIAGVLAFIIGIDYLGEISESGYPYPTYIIAIGYLIIVLGLGSIMYGAKRLIDDVKKAAR